MKYLILFFILISNCFATYKPYPLNTTVKGISFVSAYITNGGACAISSQDGGWIQSVSRPSAGQCDLDITGYFSAAPHCFVRCLTPSYFGILGSVTSTNVSAVCGTVSTQTDTNFHILCYGAK